MGRIITLSIAVLAIVGQTSVVRSKAAGESGERAPKPAAYAVADGFTSQRSFVPRRYGAPTRCAPNPNAPSIEELDPGLRYFGPCERPPARRG